MLHPQRIQVQTIAAPRRISRAHLIRRPVDASRLRAVWRAEIYGALLRLEERAEQARDALRAENDVEAAVIGREILAAACLVGRGLHRLRTLP
jgi:hypothetical protein